MTLTFNDYVSNITKFDNPDRSFAKKYYEGMRWGEIWGYRIDGCSPRTRKPATTPSTRRP